MGTDDIDERDKAMREYTRFLCLAESQSDHRLMHCGSSGRSSQLEHINIQRAEWWINLLRSPTEPGQPQSSTDVSFFLFYFYFYSCYYYIVR